MQTEERQKFSWPPRFDSNPAPEPKAAEGPGLAAAGGALASSAVIAEAIQIAGTGVLIVWA